MINNPFNAPVYHEESVGSTMDVSRRLAAMGEAHGTVISADFQEAGRGRIHGRPWDTEKGAGLSFTILLRYRRIEAIPPALTLRTGLAVALAIEEFAPALAGQVMIKWPNDIVISDCSGYAKKLVGILTEADGGTVHIGIGVNVAQTRFPDFLKDKASSISLAARIEISCEKRYALLETILTCLRRELDAEGKNGSDWKNRIEERLYQKGRQVTFAEGAADSGKMVGGILIGIDEGGALLIAPEYGTPNFGAVENEVHSFSTGELMYSYTPCHKQP